MLQLAIDKKTNEATVAVDDIKKEIGRIAKKLIKLIAVTEQNNTDLVLKNAFLATQRLLQYRNTFTGIKGKLSLYGKDESKDVNGKEIYANYTGIFHIAASPQEFNSALHAAVEIGNVLKNTDISESAKFIIDLLGLKKPVANNFIEFERNLKKELSSN